MDIIITKYKEKEMDQNMFMDIVRKEVGLKVACGESFTAYDITKAMQHWMKARFEHFNVRNCIATLINAHDHVLVNDRYISTRLELFDGQKVVVYHSKDTDPSIHVNKINNILKPTQSPSSVTTGCGPNCTCGDRDDEIERLKETVDEYYAELLEKTKTISELEDDLEDKTTVLNDILNMLKFN